MIRFLARFSVQNSVAVNLATLTAVVAGVLAYLSMPREVFPDFSLGTVTVRTLYPGAAPEDVERLVTLPLEEKLEGIDGLREMTSVSQEGYSLITLTTLAGTDASRFLDDTRAAATSGDLELPDAVEDPVIREIKAEFPAIGFFVYGQVTEDELRVLAERHKRELEKIPGVARVIMQGAREPRIWVEVDPVSLERYGLTLDDVGRAVGGRSADVPLGSLTTTSGDYLLRVEAGILRADDLLDLFVQRRPDGSGVRLSEVAHVADTYERRITRARYNGQPSIYLRVNKAASGDAIDICSDVYAYIEAEKPNLPAGVALGTNGDLSVYVRNRLRVMRDSAVIGGLLVLVSLILFLNLRIALITALGIPVAFLGGLVMAYALGISMNMLTMFALIVVLGMIVDDAIVVGENAYRLMEEGLSPVQAAIQGTVEVGKPVMATILTTIAAFLPTLLISGMMGKFMRPLPIIVTFCLIASLAEALLVLPAHLAHWVGHVRAPGEEGKAARRWYDPLRDAYLRFLELGLRWRYVTLTATFTGIFLLVGLAAYRVPFVLFDDFESKVFSINVRALPGTPLEETDRLITEIERVVAQLPPNELESTNTVAGVSYDDASRFTVGQNLGQVWVELREDTVERRPTSAIIEGLRERLVVLPPRVESIDIVQPQAGPAGKPIDISIRGPELVELERIAARIEGDLAGFRGTRDVFDNSEPGKREVRIRLTDAGRFLGFDEATLAAELRASFEGTRFARVRRGKDDVEIVVKLPEELRRARGEIERLPVGGVPAGNPSADGAPSPAVRTTPVPLGMVAELYETDGPAVISRDDGERSVRVYGDVNTEEGNAVEITGAVMAKYGQPGALPPGYSVELKGEQRDTAESFEGLKLSLLMALFLIYMILGSLFRSVAQPLVIMSAIPFGAVGMILGHLAMGRVLSFMSLIGFVALTGIVVNDSLILIDFVNQRRREGLSLKEALLVAGRQRFRPILLTSVTTMLGLSPLTFFASGQARFLQPMAITIFFGLACSTLLILVVVPCAYGVLEDLRAFVRQPLRTLGDLAQGRSLEHPPLPSPLQDLGT